MTTTNNDCSQKTTTTDEEDNDRQDRTVPDRQDIQDRETHADTL